MQRSRKQSVTEQRLARHNLRQLFCRNRPAVEPALSFIASEPEQHLRLVAGLDAFGHRAQAETLAQTDDRRRDLAAFERDPHRPDKSGVHLQFIERQRLQVPQARIAGAEVVQREPHAQVLQFAGDRACLHDVAHERAFRYFKHEALQRKSAGLRHALDLAGQVRIAELQRRNINRDRDLWGDHGSRCEDLPQQPLSQFADTAGLFGHWNELVR